MTEKTKDCPIMTSNGVVQRCNTNCEWYAEKGCVISLLPKVITHLKTIAGNPPENEN